MLKKSITYENPFTEKQVTEDHYFHISKADLIEMELEEHKLVYNAKDGEKYTGMQAKLHKIMDSEDGKGIIAELNDIIRRSYGKKDGDRFLQSREIWEDFASSEAYSQLRFEVMTDPVVAAEFIQGAFPKNLDQVAEDIRKRAEERGIIGEDGQVDQEVIAEYAQEAAKNGDTPRLLTQQEVADMDSDELKSGLATGKYKLS